MRCWPALTKATQASCRAAGWQLLVVVRLALIVACLCSPPRGLVWAATTQAAQPQLPLQAARIERTRHGRTDRVIVRLKPGMSCIVRQAPDGLLVNLTTPALLAPSALAVRGPGVTIQSLWIKEVTATPTGARLTLVAGAHPRVRTLPDRVVIDLDETEAPLLPGQYRPEAAPSAQAKASVPEPVAPRAKHLPGELQHDARPVPVGVTVQAAPLAVAPAPAPAAGLDAVAAALHPPSAPSAMPVSVSLLPDATLGGPSILLPMEHLSGAAAYTRGGILHMVFDNSRLLDLSQLKDDPAFGAAMERQFQDATELRMPLAGDVQPRLSRRTDGWVLTLTAAASPLAALQGKAQHAALRFAADSPGHVVVVDDDVTGGRLFVGTQRGTGQRAAGGHRSAEWAILPSFLGLVVQPLSDRVRLQADDAGFTLVAAEPPELALYWPDHAGPLAPEGRTMTRRFDLPNLSMSSLKVRLLEALRDAAVSPPASRTQPRVRVAQAMLAAGLDTDAAAVLQVAAADDPTAVSDPSRLGLAAIAAWLSAQAGGAMPPSPGFDTARLGDSDEASVWRALWRVGDADVAGPAASLATRWRILLDYPAGLRRTMLPAVADLLLRGGQDQALAQLLQSFPDSSLDLARAEVAQRHGKMDDCLAILDRLASGADRHLRALAGEAAVEQRLSAHRLDTSAAADALDKQFYAWRGGDRELRLRLRTAALRAQGGEWRRAMTLLHETEQQEPDAHDRIHAAEVAIISGLLSDGRAATLSAMDLLALAEEASSLLGPASPDAALAPLIADRLVALDLPARAEPILRHLLEQAGDGPAKAALGFKLAGVLAERGVPQEALAVLAKSEADGTQATTADGRALLRARLLAQSGQDQEAIGLLAPVPGKAAAELQATIRETTHDWAGAAQALRTFSDSPQFVPLSTPEKQQAVLRAARDAGEAGDTAGLRDLRTRFASLFTGTASAGLFAVLTADPVTKVADLSRSGRELETIRALPATLSLTAAR